MAAAHREEALSAAMPKEEEPLVAERRKVPAAGCQVCPAYQE